MTQPDIFLPYPPQPARLKGRLVELQPMTAAHAQGLRDTVADGELWRLWYTGVPTPQNIDGWIERSLALQNDGLALPFVVIDQGNGQVVGATRYMNIEPDRRRLEIGTTFYAARVQRTSVNTEAKLLLLSHAFERLNCIAVEFRTHFFNFRSREAIARLGAKQDGILRNHNQLGDGSMRDTVVFSILNSEWPAVRSHLNFRLARHGLPAAS